jgi:hypothetical protein
MRFENTTRFPALLLRTAIDPDRLSASVITRVTFDIRGDRLVPCEEQPYLVSQEPWDSPHGAFEGDQPFKTGGVDIFVFGSAHAPAGRPTPTASVCVQLGELRREVRVFGPRTWQRVAGELVPSKPAPFVSVPLTLRFAFGGKSVWDGLEMPWPDNPDGLGFYVEEAQAEGQPLPQLEDPAHLIQRWDDRPPVVGFGVCPLQSGPRLAAGVTFDAEKQALTSVSPRVLNMAFPELVAAKVSPGAPMTLLGVTPAGRLRFHLPSALPQARLRLGDAVHERPLEIDQVGVDVDAGRVFLRYRFPFRYRFIAEQERAVTLAYEV